LPSAPSPPAQRHAEAAARNAPSLGAAARRGAGLFGLWLVLGSGTAPADLAVGAMAASLGVWASLRLLPPARGGLRPGAALRLVGEILRASVAGGLDIARRVFDPALPIRPGDVVVPLALPPGTARDAFRLLLSLQPGTLPTGLDSEGRLVLHALDTAQPVAAETRAAEALFVAAAGRGAHG
jgi:multicomponent Na+:H+ antiporter subunit E